MVIGIGGCSQSGKSTLALQLLEKIKGLGIESINLDIDDFAQPTSEIPWIRFHVDWEIPASIDFAKYEAAILQAKSDYEIVICNGFLIYHDPIIYQHFDKCLFVDVSKNVFLKRKKKDFRWGREPDWYIEYIWTSYLKYGEVDHLEEVLVLNGEKDIDLQHILEVVPALGVINDI